MKVTKKLFKSKTLANGEHPIEIKLHHKKTKYYATGASCFPTAWKNDRVYSNDKDYKEKNNLIDTAYETIMSRIREFDRLELDYDLNIICTRDRIDIEAIKTNKPIIIPPSHPTNIFEIIELKKTTVSANTARNYDHLATGLKKYYKSNNININDIDQEWFDGFIRKISIDPTKAKRGYEKRFITNFKSVYTFAFKRGYLTQYHSLEYNAKQYRSLPTNRALNHKQMFGIYGSYKYLIQQNSLNVYRKSDTTAVHVWLCMLVTGLANVDIAKLRVKDLKIKDIQIEYHLNPDKLKDPEYINERMFNGKLYPKMAKVYHIQGFRSKSGTPYNIVLDYNKAAFLFEPYLIDKYGNIKEDDEFLFPIFSTDKERDELKAAKRIENYFSKLAVNLNHVTKHHEISEHVTYYSARHTLITQLRYIGVPDAIIMLLTGKQAAGGLDVYTSSNEPAKILDATNKMFHLLDNFNI